MRIVINIPDCAPVRSYPISTLKDGLLWFLSCALGISCDNVEVEVER